MYTMYPMIVTIISYVILSSSSNIIISTANAKAKAAKISNPPFRKEVFLISVYFLIAS